MRPRIFVSSTFYDLKYIREDLANYIKAHDFEPILFEDGDIGYTPFTALDDSCYKAMESADMALLIVGGNYGSPATGEKPDDFKEFISVTRREFQKGVEQGIPFYVFVDRNVYAEYSIYELNAKEIDSGACQIKFRSAKNINVFRFIREVQSIKQIAITEFDKVADIKDFLSKQWADMFKTYLSAMKEQKEIEQLQETISNMNVLIEKMDRILDAVGKEVLKNSQEEYQQIVEENEKAEAKAICLLLSKLIQVDVDKTKIKKRSSQVKTLLIALNNFFAMQEALALEENTIPEDLPSEESEMLINKFIYSLIEEGIFVRMVAMSLLEERTRIHPYLSDSDRMKDIHSLLCSGAYYYRIFKVINSTSPSVVTTNDT